MKPIFLFVQGGYNLGIGHIRRSLAIADCLKKHGYYNTSFVIEGPPEVMALVTDNDFSLFDERLLFEQREGIVIVDRKDDITDAVNHFKDNGLKVCLVDNATDARLYSDLVIYPIAHFRDELDWNGYGGTKLIGSEFFPLSKEFLVFESSPLEDRRNILITMGGADPNNLTLKVMDAIREIGNARVDIVVGALCKHRKELSEFENSCEENWRLHYGGRSMPELMSQAAVAISAFGITLYELAFMGVPTIIINNYLEDEKSAEVFARHGSAIALGYHETVTSDEIIAAVEKLHSNTTLAMDMSNRGHCLVDGKGSERTVEALKNLIH